MIDPTGTPGQICMDRYTLPPSRRTLLLVLADLFEHQQKGPPTRRTSAATGSGVCIVRGILQNVHLL